MLNILFTIVLGVSQYNVVLDCKELGYTFFPLDDNKQNRTLYICTDYPGQTAQLVDHELLHICMHQHSHLYKTPQEMDSHLHNELYTEEYIAAQVAPCLIDNQSKLFSALESHHVHIPRDGPSNHRGAHSR